MKMPADVICEEIRKSGSISFARFMELALYCPETGYYEGNKDKIGRGGDFVTSVSAGSLFGELLAFQIAEWLQELPAHDPNRARHAGGGDGGPAIVEAGAHDGRLAGDILAWLELNRPSVFERLHYMLVEPSARRREWQREILERFGSRVRWCESLRSLVRPGFAGILLCNELLDAFPVRRFGWDAVGKHWFEWGVGLEGEGLQWRRMDAPVPGSEIPCPPELEPVLPDNFIIETSPAAETWWREAAGQLVSGKLLAIDYGYSAQEMISPARTGGTLRAYCRHQVTHDLLAEPGEQDLTAHVNFTAIQTAGVAAGLRTLAFCSQPQFLTQIVRQAVASGCFAPMSPKQVRQFQTLTHPEHLGRAFRVLVQGR
jgi:SAM-dependent MidA family methyltransferase